MFWILVAASVLSPPDYVSLTERSDRLAQVATSAKSCERFGFKVDGAGVQKEAQRIIDDAVVSGVSGGDAETIFAGSMERERNYQSQRSSSVKTEDDLAEFLKYWSRRCTALSSDESYGQYFHRIE